jgi:23S rRNA pseudouridine1911/1915/1917 synthase
MSKRAFLVSADAVGLRLDQSLAQHVPELSQRTATIALDLGCVFVNRKRNKTASHILREGDHVLVHLGGAFERALAGKEEPASNAGWSILLEDEHIVVVVKPAGLLTAPTPEGDRGNLLHALETRGGTQQRHFVVHRLDLQTSGVLVFAKSDVANRKLAEIFRTHDLTRQYDVFCAGEFPYESFSVRAPIDGKAAVTQLERQLVLASCSWLKATLETGRTHQIRKHLQGLGHPVLGDPRYGTRSKNAPPRMALHARRLAFAHPISGEALDFEAPLPAELASWLETQRSST